MSQKQFVVNKLNSDGFITRNYCLKNYISRLGSIINILNNEGWKIKGHHQENGDYIYEVDNSPYKKEYFRLPDGSIISRIITKKT